MQIPILAGAYTDSDSNYRVSYPVNLFPIPQSQGISDGYMRPADGIVSFATGQGNDRGAINWNDEVYRASGTKLIKVASNGAVTVLGDIGGTDQVSFTYSFDRLAVASNGNLYYYDPVGGFVQVTDPDLGTVIDVVWVDGYFMTTDGEFLVVTELSDPTQVNPLKYGSSEADPDPVVSLVKVRNEIYAINRYTSEVFDNVGGELFPFQRIEGGQIMRGCVGTHAAIEFLGGIVMLGGGRNEPVSLWLCSNANAEKLSSREVDLILQGYTEEQLSTVVIEKRIDGSFKQVYIHLPDKTLVYDFAASQAVQRPAWTILKNGNTYDARNMVWCYNKWIVGDPFSSRIGYYDSSIGSHYGDAVEWEVQTKILYNNANGAVIHRLEIVGITGNNTGPNNTIYTSYSTDGVNWSAEKSISAGVAGDYAKRLVWFKQGILRNYRIQKIRGSSDAMLSIAALDATIEPLVF